MGENNITNVCLCLLCFTQKVFAKLPPSTAFCINFQKTRPRQNISKKNKSVPTKTQKQKKATTNSGKTNNPDLENMNNDNEKEQTNPSIKTSNGEEYLAMTDKDYRFRLTISAIQNNEKNETKMIENCNMSYFGSFLFLFFFFFLYFWVFSKFFYFYFFYFFSQKVCMINANTRIKKSMFFAHLGLTNIQFKRLICFVIGNAFSFGNEGVLAMWVTVYLKDRL